MTDSATFLPSNLHHYAARATRPSIVSEPAVPPPGGPHLMKQTWSVESHQTTALGKVETVPTVPETEQAGA